jgi:hypothetical protein
VAAAQNAFKKIEGLLFAGTIIGTHTPGLKTGAATTDIFTIAPGHGISGGMFIIDAPVQYAIIAGPIICKRLDVFELFVWVNNEIN